MPAAVDVLPRHRRQGLGRCGVDAAAALREIYRRDLGAQGFRVVLLEYFIIWWHYGRQRTARCWCS